jgi:hypothetical protein
MNGRLLGILAVAAAIALAAWLGFSDGREHGPASLVQGSAGS